MPNMFEALSQFGSTAIDPPKTTQMSGPFVRDLPRLVQKVATDYLQFNIPLNDGIAKIASEKGLNEDQVQRIITEANNQVYMTKFANLKYSAEKSVDFDLASKQGVYDSMKPKKVEKTASTKTELNFFNYTPEYWPGDLKPEKPTDFNKIAATKIIDNDKNLKRHIEKQAMTVCNDLMNCAYTLLKYESLEKGAAQKAFNELCKTAEIPMDKQLLYKNAMKKKASALVSEHNLAPNVDCNIDFCDISHKDADFSLGDFSLNKQASSTWDVVQTDTGEVVDGMTGLVKLARDCEAAMNKMNELKSVREDLKKVLDNIREGDV